MRDQLSYTTALGKGLREFPFSDISLTFDIFKPEFPEKEVPMSSDKIVTSQATVQVQPGIFLFGIVLLFWHIRECGSSLGQSLCQQVSLMDASTWSVLKQHQADKQTEKMDAQHINSSCCTSCTMHSRALQSDCKTTVLSQLTAAEVLLIINFCQRKWVREQVHLQRTLNKNTCPELMNQNSTHTGTLLLQQLIYTEFKSIWH